MQQRHRDERNGTQRSEQKNPDGARGAVYPLPGAAEGDEL